MAISPNLIGGSGKICDNSADGSAGFAAIGVRNDCRQDCQIHIPNPSPLLARLQAHSAESQNTAKCFHPLIIEQKFISGKRFWFEFPNLWCDDIQFQIGKYLLSLALLCPTASEPLHKEIQQCLGNQNNVTIIIKFIYAQQDILAMPRIFISYRRDDSRDATERIHDRLVQVFGLKNVFLDVDKKHIPSGSDFETVLREAVRQCDVLLVIIGPDWLDIRKPDDPNVRRLDDPTDFVHIEIETGLQNLTTLVIPVLVKGAEPLPTNELPKSIRELAGIQVERVRRNPDFHKDVNDLIQLIRLRFPTRRRLYLGVIGTIITFFVLMAVALATNRSIDGIVLTPAPATVVLLVLTQNAGETLTVDATQTVNALITEYFITQAAYAAETNAAYTNTPTITFTPTATPTATEDFNVTATQDALTLVAVQQAADAQMTLDAENTLNAQQATAVQATLNAQETANVPTNTSQPTLTPSPIPTATSTSTPTFTPTSTPTSRPTSTSTATATIDLTETANGLETQTHATAIAATNAVQVAQATLNAQAAQATPAFTLTPFVSLTPTLEPIALETLGIGANGLSVNLRNGPSTSENLVLQIPSGVIMKIIGTNEDRTWFNVQLPDGVEGWVRSDLITRMPVIRNADWIPLIATFDGIKMGLVPTGCFMMGNDDLKYPGASSPRHQFCFSKPFWIDQTEVTEGMYTSCSVCLKWFGQPRRSTQAIDGVSWGDAKKYCEWRNARLPTEAEWEYAARGPDSVAFSWGNNPQTIFIPSFSNGQSDQPADVKSNSIDKSWVGVYDLMGNLKEWTHSVYRVYPYDATDGRENDEITSEVRVLRGVSATQRETGRGNSSGNDFWGFRCARDY